jgi:hypothetical protein
LSDERLSLEQLYDLGWTIDRRKGVSQPRFVSVSLCLMREGRRSLCIPGYGNTRLQALEDAGRNANAWIARQRDEDAESPVPPTQRGGRHRRPLDPTNIEIEEPPTGPLPTSTDCL